jgi:hypothetical protein
MIETLKLEPPDVLSNPERHHLVQFYTQEKPFFESVAFFIHEGLRKKERVLLVARQKNLAGFKEVLEKEGWDWKTLMDSGLLACFRAEEVMEKFIRNGEPQWALFDSVVGQLVRNLNADGVPLRIYGEIVDILWQDGKKHAAVQLEEFWNQLQKTESFSLLCAYALDPLNHDNYDSAFAGVCQTHSCFVSPGEEKLQSSLEETIRATFPETVAKIVLGLARKSKPKSMTMQAQHYLLWLHETMPFSLKKILALLRNSFV